MRFNYDMVVTTQLHSVYPFYNLDETLLQLVKSKYKGKNTNGFFVEDVIKIVSRSEPFFRFVSSVCEVTVICRAICTKYNPGDITTINITYDNNEFLTGTCADGITIGVILSDPPSRDYDKVIDGLCKIYSSLRVGDTIPVTVRVTQYDLLETSPKATLTLLTPFVPMFYELGDEEYKFENITPEYEKFLINSIKYILDGVKQNAFSSDLVELYSNSSLEQCPHIGKFDLKTLFKSIVSNNSISIDDIKKIIVKGKFYFINSPYELNLMDTSKSKIDLHTRSVIQQILKLSVIHIFEAIVGQMFGYITAVNTVSSNKILSKKMLKIIS